MGMILLRTLHDPWLFMNAKWNSVPKAFPSHGESFMEPLWHVMTAVRGGGPKRVITIYGDGDGFDGTTGLSRGRSKMAYDIIGQPVYVKPHVCELPNIQVPYANRPRGIHTKTIIRCQDCGLRWYSSMYADEAAMYLENRWLKLRWYHFRVKKFIAKEYK